MIPEVPLNKRAELSLEDRVKQHVNDLELQRGQFKTPMAEITDDREGWWRRGYDDAMRSALVGAQGILDP